MRGSLSPQSCQAVPSTSGQSAPTVKPLHVARRAALASLAASMFAMSNMPAQAAEEAPTVYFGNGCFWGRQHDQSQTEQTLGRKGENISAVVGYAGGADQGKNGLVCYYYGPRDSVYENLGHAEVVQLELNRESSQARQEMEAFADTYFRQFRKTPMGMMRLDPQDFGPAYRNVIGLPGGTSSPLFDILKARNLNKMQLVAGEGNSQAAPGREGDAFNKVFIVDSNKLPFHPAEQYHQFHNGIGVPFPASYTQKQKAIAKQAGRIYPTGCPEF